MILKLLKLGAILEGISVIGLFFIAIPLKYFWGNSTIMPSIGMIHGILFVIYSILVVLATQEQRWNIKKLLLLLFLGFVPLGTFYAERKLI